MSVAISDEAGSPVRVAAEPRVCVVVISYNSSSTLPRCLEGLAAQTYKDFRLLLIDNASLERPAALLSHLPFPVSYVEMNTNLGFAGGMTAALAATKAPLLAALNPDAFPDPTWLAELVAAADRHPDVAAIGSLQIDAKNKNALDGFGDHYLIWGQAWRGRTWPRRISGDGVDYCFGVCAAAALYRADILRAVGGFDSRFFCFYEDVDVAFRLRLAGYHCAVARAAMVEHVGGASFTGQSDFAVFLIARNQWWVMVKNLPGPLLIAALPGFFALHAAAAVLRYNRARLRGLWHGLRGTGEFWTARRAIQRSRIRAAGGLLPWLAWNPWDFFRRRSLTRPAR